jgi:anaphase-promoting complex subunit 2
VGNAAAGQNRALRRNLAWSTATRFLSLPRDLDNSARRVERSRDVDEALEYLLVGEKKSDEGLEEGLVDWYTNEMRLHFATCVRPGLNSLWAKVSPAETARERSVV